MTSPMESLPTPPPGRLSASSTEEVLEALEVLGSLAQIESRLDSLEIDIARESGSREEHARHVVGEMSVMKARIDDFLSAFNAALDESRGGGVADRVAELDQTELRAAVEALRTDIAERAQDLRRQIGASVATAMAEMQQALDSGAYATRAHIDPVVSRLESLSEGNAADIKALEERVNGLQRQVEDGFKRLGKAVLKVADGVSGTVGASQRLAEIEVRLAALSPRRRRS